MAHLPSSVVSPPGQQAVSTNDVVGRLPADVRAAVLRQATRVSLAKDQVLCDVSLELSWAYLPCSGLISLQALTEDGNSVDVAIVARDGVIGFAPGVAARTAIHRAVVSVPGEALRLRNDALQAEFDRSPAVRAVLLTCWHTCLAEITQSSVCHRFHSARQRLARWLLTACDRAGATRFQLTQEELAQRLGVQRTGVTAANLELQDAGAIRSRHGQVVIVDRRRLEPLACECYRLTPKSPSATNLAHP